MDRENIRPGVVIRSYISGGFYLIEQVNDDEVTCRNINENRSVELRLGYVLHFEHIEQ